MVVSAWNKECQEFLLLRECSALLLAAKLCCRRSLVLGRVEKARIAKDETSKLDIPSRQSPLYLFFQVNHIE